MAAAREPHQLARKVFEISDAKGVVGLQQAGNKSAVSYRTDIGVSGYTGFIPQSKALLVEPKASVGHLPPFPCDYVRQRAGIENAGDDRQKSM